MKAEYLAGGKETLPAFCTQVYHKGQIANRLGANDDRILSRGQVVVSSLMRASSLNIHAEIKAAGLN